MAASPYRSVRVHGLTTSYIEAGDPSASPLVLLHDGAFGSDAASCWESLIPLLEDRYRILAPDLLGHGGTAKVFRFDMDPMSQRLWHLQGFCETLELDQAAFVGSSFGGGMVLHAAVRRSVPMRAGVSICGPGGIFMIPEQFGKLQGYEPSEEAARGIAQFFMAEPDDAEVKRRLEASMAPGHWEALAAVRLSNPAKTTEAPDWRPMFKGALGGVDVPILLIAGERDRLLEEDWERQIAELIPDGQSTEIPGALHLPHADAPQAVADAIKEFLAR